MIYFAVILMFASPFIAFASPVAGFVCLVTSIGFVKWSESRGDVAYL